MSDQYQWHHVSVLSEPHPLSICRECSLTERKRTHRWIEMQFRLSISLWWSTQSSTFSQISCWSGMFLKINRSIAHSIVLFSAQFYFIWAVCYKMIPLKLLLVILTSLCVTVSAIVFLIPLQGRVRSGSTWPMSIPSPPSTSCQTGRTSPLCTSSSETSLLTTSAGQTQMLGTNFVRIVFFFFYFRKIKFS